MNEKINTIRTYLGMVGYLLFWITIFVTFLTTAAYFITFDSLLVNRLLVYFVILIICLLMMAVYPEKQEYGFRGSGKTYQNAIIAIDQMRKGNKVITDYKCEHAISITEYLINVRMEKNAFFYLRDCPKDDRMVCNHPNAPYIFYQGKRDNFLCDKARKCGDCPIGRI